MIIKAIIGLGNPGPRFLLTRHNIGFRVIDALVETTGGNWRKKPEMDYLEVQINGHPVIVVKPQTFMNLSGKVWPYLQKRGITVEQLLVVHDELEKPFGSVTLKQGGSAKGHNGLKSIIAHCGPEFWRVRCGIGRPDDKNQVPDYVLERFKENPEQVDHMIAEAVKLIMNPA